MAIPRTPETVALHRALAELAHSYVQRSMTAAGEAEESRNEPRLNGYYDAASIALEQAALDLRNLLLRFPVEGEHISEGGEHDPR